MDFPETSTEPTGRGERDGGEREEVTNNNTDKDIAKVNVVDIYSVYQTRKPLFCYVLLV